jgi:hypothetical protein
MTRFTGQSLPKPGIQLSPALFASAIFVNRLEGASREERVAPAGSVRRTISSAHADDASSKQGDWKVGLRRQMLRL